MLSVEPYRSENSRVPYVKETRNIVRDEAIGEVGGEVLKFTDAGKVYGDIESYVF
jgi:hypothetical protein